LEDPIPNAGRIGSVDFSANHFHMPDFKASRNLVQNPSFEDGLDFWALSGVDGKDGAMKADGSPLITLDGTTAVDGRFSLCQEVIEGTAHPPATFAIPVEEGGDYVLSFYAKTDKPDEAKFGVGGCTDMWDNFLKRVQYRLGKDWKRHTYRFTAPKKVVQIYMGCPRDASPCRVWIDAVQLEKGTTATEFTRSPVSVTLRSNSRENLSEPGKPADARLLVNTRAPAKGSVSYTLRDFFGTVKASGKASFETKTADTPVAIAVPECDTLPSGEYVIETRTELSDGFSRADWHRLVRMAYMDGTHKNRHQFTYAGVHAMAGDWERGVAFFKRMGVGSSIIFDTPPQQYQNLLKKYDIPYYPTCFHYTGWPGTLIGKYNLGSSTNGSRPDMSVSAITDADIPLIVEHALKVMAENPNCTAFKTINEPFCQTEAEIARVVEILKAVRTAAKKVNPNIRIMTPDCANIDHAMSYLETFFKHGGAEACDIVAVHMYRGHPDGMDEDVTKLERLTDRYKPGAEIWSTEGGYFNTYIIPDLKFPVVSHGGDHYRAGNFSYDLGLGEKIATAYETRYRIQSLKHAARLKMDQDWNLIADWRTYFGVDGIPSAYVFSVNTLARLLGNAEFASDLKLPKELRGYLFKDEKERPVVALWFTNGENLYNKLPPAVLDAKGLGKIEVFDMMGAPVDVVSNKIGISGYPVFIRGEPGQAGALQKTLEAAPVTLPEFGDALGFTFDFKADGAFLPTFANRFNRPLAGKLVCLGGAKTLYEQDIALQPYAMLQPTFQFPAAKEAATDKTFSYTFTPAKGPSLDKGVTLRYAGIRKVNQETFKMDGKFAKWETIPALVPDNVNRVNPAGDVPGDFKVETKWAWNEAFLYCAVFVTDNDFSPSKTIQFPDMGDSVTFVFDSYADKMKTGQQGFGEDDQDFMTWFTGDGKVNLIRRRCPHWQLSFSQPGTVAGTQSAFERTSDGCRFELAIPMREAKPIELKDGGCFGMNTLVYDYDKGKQTGSAHFGSGAPPLSWRAPEEYVFLFLEPMAK